MENNYPVFTKEMVKDYTILIPSMLDTHMILFSRVLQNCGYKCKVLDNFDGVCEVGLRYVHNDTCYPATLVIGQFIDALNKMKDTSKVALILTQTGGGCRASNYIHLLRKALIKANYGHVPVISLSMQGLEKSGFKITFSMVQKLAAALLYGDLIMYLHNKTRSSEVHKGETKQLVNRLCQELADKLEHGFGITKRNLRKNFKYIIDEFSKIELDGIPKIKVGIVGEIYVKYASLGNNNLEEFLVSQGAEVNVPGLLGFMDYNFYVNLFDKELYGGSKLKNLIFKWLIKFVDKREAIMIDELKKSKFEPMNPFSHTVNLNEGILSHGVKMGEGFLLTAEMVELIQEGYENIVCAQPFGCLPNHICGKGVMKNIKEHYPNSNIVAIDYDPSATKVNQENRIKLMLAIAKENLNAKNK
ncbi:MAG: 2-hydroxyacyl-CoA dehydratase [Bacilli bacterium]|nr:2-hydroxyacyl-CoA dehydratase [Bacilli bacterium]